MSTIRIRNNETINALTPEELFEYGKLKNLSNTAFAFWNDGDKNAWIDPLLRVSVDFSRNNRTTYIPVSNSATAYKYIGIIPEEPQLPDALPDLKIYRGEPASTYGITAYGGFMTWNDVIEKWEGKTFVRMEVGDIFYVDLSRPSVRILAEAQKVRDDFINSRTNE